MSKKIDFMDIFSNKENMKNSLNVDINHKASLNHQELIDLGKKQFLEATKIKENFRNSFSGVNPTSTTPNSQNLRI
jgi:hypothetical protein